VAFANALRRNIVRTINTTPTDNGEFRRPCFGTWDIESSDVPILSLENSCTNVIHCFAQYLQANAGIDRWESSMDFRNVGILPHDYTASQPRRPRFESSPPWKLQILYNLYISTAVRTSEVGVILWSLNDGLSLSVHIKELCYLLWLHFSSSPLNMRSKAYCCCFSSSVTQYAHHFLCLFLLMTTSENI